MCNCVSNRDDVDVNSVCPRCGRNFYCCMEGSGGYCWCMSLPKIDLDRDLFPGRCLCKNCLDELRNPIKEKYNEIKEAR